MLVFYQARTGCQKYYDANCNRFHSSQIIERAKCPKSNVSFSYQNRTEVSGTGLGRIFLPETNVSGNQQCNKPTNQGVKVLKMPPNVCGRFIAFGMRNGIDFGIDKEINKQKKEALHYLSSGWSSQCNGR